VVNRAGLEPGFELASPAWTGVDLGPSGGVVDPINAWVDLGVEDICGVRAKGRVNRRDRIVTTPWSNARAVRGNTLPLPVQPVLATGGVRRHGGIPRGFNRRAPSVGMKRRTGLAVPARVNVWAHLRRCVAGRDFTLSIPAVLFPMVCKPGRTEEQRRRASSGGELANRAHRHGWRPGRCAWPCERAAGRVRGMFPSSHQGCAVVKPPARLDPTRHGAAGRCELIAGRSPRVG
jgi:hypothetical protein